MGSGAGIVEGGRAAGVPTGPSTDSSYGTASGTPPVSAASWVAQGPVSRALEDQRHRWFLWAPVLVAAGIGFYFALPFEPPIHAMMAVTAVAILTATFSPRGTMPFLATRVLLALVVGMAVAKARTDFATAPVLDRVVERAEVHGWIELVESQAVRGQRLTIRVGRIEGMAAGATPQRVRIRVTAKTAGLGPGDAVVVRARLSPPGEPILPGGYDFGRRAWYLGIGAVGYAFAAPVADTAAGTPPLAMRAATVVERVRLSIGAAVTAALPGQAGAIANALITGDRGAITPETDKAYRDSGLYHVLSISGLHMTVMAGTLFVVVRFLLAAVPGIALRFPIKKWAAVVAASGALGYLLISGGAFATMRSYVMISIIFAAVLAERPALAMHNVALAALVLLLLWPESLLDPGFQMSFAAVVALLAALEAWRAREEMLGPSGDGPRGFLTGVFRFVSGIVLSTLIAGTAVAPIAAYHFHASQPYAVLGNVLGVPLCDVLVMPALLAALVAMPFGLEAFPLAIAGLAIDLMTAVARWVASLPGAVATIPSISLLGLLAMVAGGLWAMLWISQMRYLGLAAIAAGIALAPLHQRPDILISRDGSLVVARVDGAFLAVAPFVEGADGRPRRRAASLAAGRSFELSRWLEADGDGRSAATVAASGRGFQCDGAGCTAIVRGRRLAVTRHAAGAADDCARADILVVSGPRPKVCAGPKVVIDAIARSAGGVHAIHIARDGAVRVETVASVRGERPWSRRRGSASSAVARGATGAQSTVQADVTDDEAGHDASLFGE